MQNRSQCCNCLCPSYLRSVAVHQHKWGIRVNNSGDSLFVCRSKLARTTAAMGSGIGRPAEWWQLLAITVAQQYGSCFDAIISISITATAAATAAAAALIVAALVALLPPHGQPPTTLLLLLLLSPLVVLLVHASATKHSCCCRLCSSCCNALPAFPQALVSV